MGDVYYKLKERAYFLKRIRRRMEPDRVIRVIILIGRALDGARRLYSATKEIAQLVVETYDPGLSDLGQEL